MRNHSPKGRRRSCLGLLIVLIFTCGAQGAPLTLAENGVPKAIILVPAKPSTVEAFAADQLARALKKITGGAFEIVQEKSDVKQGDDQSLISIGRTSLAGDIAMQGPEWKQNNREAFRILRRGNALIIAGNPKSEISAQGALWGMYAFLEMQGVGSYLPDPSGDVYPEKPTLTIDEIDVTDAPWFAMRLGSETVSGFLERYQPDGDKAGQKFTDIQLISRNGSARRVDYYHMWQKVITPQVRKDHPDWFKDAHNPRFGPSPAPSDPGADDLDAGVCLSNPGIRNLFIEYIHKRFTKEPDLYGATICADDYFVGDRCDCADCKRLMAMSAPPTFPVRSPHNASDLYIDFINAVATGLEKDFPDRKLVAYAYLDTIDPPAQIRLHRNVIMMIAPLESPDEIHPAMDDITQGWRRMGATELYWYGYILSRPPVPRLMGEWFRSYKRLGIDGVYLEFSPNVGAYSSLNQWMQGKLMWNPDADVSTLVDQYCAGLFGPQVGNLMRRFFLAWETKPPFANDDIPPLLAAAEKQAGGPTTVIGKRVRMFKLGYELSRSAVDLDTALKVNDLPKAIAAARAGVEADKQLKQDYPAWVMASSVSLLNYVSAAGNNAFVIPTLERAMDSGTIKLVPESPLPGPSLCLTNNADLPMEKRKDIGITITSSSPTVNADHKGTKLFDGEVEGSDHTVENGPIPSFNIDLDLHGEYQIDRVEVCTGMNIGIGSLMQIQIVPIYIEIAVGNDGEHFTPVDRIFPRTLRGFVSSDSLSKTTRYVRLTSCSLNMIHDINEIRVWGRPKKK